MDDLYKQYSDLTEQIKKLEDLKETLKTSIEGDLVNRKITRLETDYGKFELNERKTYEYPEKIVQMEDHLKELKKDSELNGEAIIKKVTTYLRFFTKNT